MKSLYLVRRSDRHQAIRQSLSLFRNSARSRDYVVYVLDTCSSFFCWGIHTIVVTIHFVSDTMSNAAAETSRRDEKEDGEVFSNEEKMFDTLISTYDTEGAKKMSFEERQRKGQLSTRSLIYGEIRYGPFAEAMNKIKRKYGGLSSRGGTFVDLGSGTGKALFAAALCHDFTTCTGIEIVDTLYRVSLSMKRDWDRTIAPTFKRSIDGSPVSDTKIHLLRGDATTYDLSKTDVVFMCSTVFDFDLMAKFARSAGNMRTGTFMITISKDLPCANWKVLERVTRVVSWGGATMIIQQKIRPGHAFRSKFYQKREDESYRPTGTKTIFDQIRERRERVEGGDSRVSIGGSVP